MPGPRSPGGAGAPPRNGRGPAKDRAAAPRDPRALDPHRPRAPVGPRRLDPHHPFLRHVPRRVLRPRPLRRYAPASPPRCGRAFGRSRPPRGRSLRGISRRALRSPELSRAFPPRRPWAQLRAPSDVISIHGARSSRPESLRSRRRGRRRPPSDPSRSSLRHPRLGAAGEPSPRRACASLRPTLRPVQAGGRARTPATSCRVRLRPPSVPAAHRGARIPRLATSEVRPAGSWSTGRSSRPIRSAATRGAPGPRPRP
jgi:hypothetical protein